MFHFAIVEDREVFPRYELTGWVLLGLPARKRFCPLGDGALADARARGSLLDGRHSITNAEGLVIVFAWWRGESESALPNKSDLVQSAKRTSDSSPALQCWVRSPDVTSP